MLSMLKPNEIFRAWWVDPMVATLSFLLAIGIYWAEERKRGLSRFRKSEEMPMIGPSVQATIAYWIGIFIWKWTVSPPKSIPDGIPTSFADVAFLLAEIISGVVLYDLFFFFCHWAMHDLPLFHRWHISHHSSPKMEGNLEARDVLRHSLVDGAIQVLVNIAVQRHNLLWWSTVPKSRLARVSHNIIVTWMLTESHTASPSPNIFRRWCVGVREHRYHHLGYNKGYKERRCQRYQQFFGYLDDARNWYYLKA